MFPEVTALQNAIRKKSLPLILKAEQAGLLQRQLRLRQGRHRSLPQRRHGAGQAHSRSRPSPCATTSAATSTSSGSSTWPTSRARSSSCSTSRSAARREPSEADVRYVVAPAPGADRALRVACPGSGSTSTSCARSSRYAARAEDGYARAKELCKHHPAPFDAYFDAINMMGPINVLRGTREAAEFFDAAVAEFEDLVARDHGPAVRGAVPHRRRGTAPVSLLQELPEPLREVGRGRRAVDLLDGGRHLGMGLPPRSAPAARVHRRADAAART